jgi:hypothetical protein
MASYDAFVRIMPKSSNPKKALRKSSSASSQENGTADLNKSTTTRDS